MFEPEVFRKQVYCAEESTYDIVGAFPRPRSDSAPKELCPPSLRPWVALLFACVNQRSLGILQLIRKITIFYIYCNED